MGCQPVLCSSAMWQAWKCVFCVRHHLHANASVHAEGFVGQRPRQGVAVAMSVCGRVTPFAVRSSRCSWFLGWDRSGQRGPPAEHDTRLLKCRFSPTNVSPVALLLTGRDVNMLSWPTTCLCCARAPGGIQTPFGPQGSAWLPAVDLGPGSPAPA
jgi:hypothetical protein